MSYHSAQSATATEERSDPTWGGLLRHPGYARYFVAVALARVPSTMWAVAVALLVLARTGRVPALGETRADRQRGACLIAVALSPDRA